MGNVERSEFIADGLNESVIALEGITDATTIATAIDAHRHAVLALVDQQRTANLIAAVTRWGGESGSWPLAIREGLGI